MSHKGHLMLGRLLPLGHHRLIYIAWTQVCHQGGIVDPSSWPLYWYPSHLLLPTHHMITASLQWLSFLPRHWHPSHLLLPTHLCMMATNLQQLSFLPRHTTPSLKRLIGSLLRMVWVNIWGVACSFMGSCIAVVVWMANIVVIDDIWQWMQRGLPWLAITTVIISDVWWRGCWSTGHHSNPTVGWLVTTPTCPVSRPINPTTPLSANWSPLQHTLSAAPSAHHPTVSQLVTLTGHHLNLPCRLPH